MRLIDADRLNKPIYAEEDNITGSGMSYDEICGYNDGIDIVWNKIDQAPTIDAVTVVRCKDCKWFADNNGGEWYGCYMFHVVRITPEDAPKPDDFCSYGERKNGGDSDV